VSRLLFTENDSCFTVGMQSPSGDFMIVTSGGCAADVATGKLFLEVQVEIVSLTIPSLPLELVLFDCVGALVVPCNILCSLRD
jgi:hypothetical protein